MEEIESLVKTVTAADVAAEERLAAFGEIVRRFQDMAYGGISFMPWSMR